MPIFTTAAVCILLISGFCLGFAACAIMVNRRIARSQESAIQNPKSKIIIHQ